MPTLEVVSRPYECGKAVSVSRAIPGAIVQVSRGAAILGTAVANEGNAIVSVSRIPGAGNTIQVVAMPPAGYSVSGSAKITSIKTEEAPGIESLKLPMPQLDQAFAVQGCDASLHLRDLVDGSTVTLERRDTGINSTYLPTASESILRLNPVLSNKADQIHIRQSLVDCRRTDSDPLVIDVAEAARLGPLSALPPCAWSSTIFCSGCKRWGHYYCYRSGNFL